MKQTVVNIEIFTAVFLYPFLRKEVSELANRTRTNRNEFHLNDDEQYILDEKFKLSGMKSKSAFLRKLILYGYVYEVDYNYLRNYNTELGRISSCLNMQNSIEPIAPIISATKKPRTRTHISVDMKVRLSSTVVQDECLNRRAST